MCVFEIRLSRMCLHVLALCLLLSLLLAQQAFAQQGMTVNGQVQGIRGEPKQFVSISLEGPGQYVAMTNAHGAFKIRNVTKGKYTVRVRQGDLVAVFTRDVGNDPVDLVVNW